jgi:hypothetical protein
MADIDLQEIQKLVNRTRQEYLDTEKSYDEAGSDDGATATENFLLQFLGPENERSEMTRKEAAETLTLIRDFGSVRASFFNHIGILGLRAAEVIKGITAKYLQIVVTGDPSKPLPAPSVQVSDLERAKLEIENFSERRKQAEEFVTRVSKRAAEIGKHQSNIHNIAANLLLMRKATLREFRKEKVDMSWADLRARLIHLVKEAAEKELVKGSWTGLVLLVSTIAALPILPSYGPFILPVLLILWKLQSYWRKGKVGNRNRTDTDEMQDLLNRLRCENKLFLKLDEVYANAQTELDQVAASVA